MAARKASPSAASPTPIHSRRVTEWANSRSATTVSRTRPPAITACTIEIGASASAATWKPQEPIAIRIPITYQRFLNRAREVRTGRCHSTSGDWTAPRCL